MYPNNSSDPAAILETYETQARQIPATRQFLNPWILKLQGSLAQTSKQAEAVSKLPTITTTDGKIYTGVTITKADPDGIRIMHEAGSAKIPFEKLPEALRAKYGYDVAKATEFRRNQAAKDEATEKAMETSIQKSEAPRQTKRTLNRLTPPLETSLRARLRKKKSLPSIQRMHRSFIAPKLKRN